MPSRVLTNPWHAAIAFLRLTKPRTLPGKCTEKSRLYTLDIISTSSVDSKIDLRNRFTLVAVFPIPNSRSSASSTPTQPAQATTRTSQPMVRCGPASGMTGSSRFCLDRFVSTLWRSKVPMVSTGSPGSHRDGFKEHSGYTLKRERLVEKRLRGFRTAIEYRILSLFASRDEPKGAA